MSAFFMKGIENRAIEKKDCLMKFKKRIYSAKLCRFVPLKIIVLKKNTLLSVFAVVAIVIVSCAKIVAPTGGPLDFDPPVLLSCKPVQESTNFKGKSFELFFDEYVALKDVNQQLVVSPPLPKKPRVILKGKSVLIEVNNNLDDSTTYTFNFGNSIADNNEGNPLQNFKYIFSTGDKLDSLAVSGQVINAFTLQPEKDPVTVVLYANLNDTAPSKVLPTYIGRTDKRGIFSIQNIRKGKYHLYALADANQNLKYDKGSELFAFRDTIVDLDPAVLKRMPEPVPEIDTVRIKKLKEVKEKDVARRRKKGEVVTDTIFTDSVKFVPKMLYGLYSNVKLFNELPDEVYLKDKDRKQDNKLVFNFNRAPYQKPEIKLLNNANDKWFIANHSASCDSMVFWITDSLLSKRDTLLAEVRFKSIKKGDTISICDTINMRFTHKEKKKKNGDENEKKPGLNVLFAASESMALDLNRDLLIECKEPIGKIQTDSAFLYQLIDSTTTPVKFAIIRDTISPCKAWLRFKSIEESRYVLDFMPGTITSVYGLKNDTLEHKFVSQKSSFYGKLIVTTDIMPYPVIVQLWDKDKFIKQLIVDSKTGKTTFNQLQPGLYTLKLVYDTNGNSKWDEGSFMLKHQPEEVYFYPELVKVRSDWEIEVACNKPVTK